MELTNRIKNIRNQQPHTMEDIVRSINPSLVGLVVTASLSVAFLFPRLLSKLTSSSSKQPQQQHCSSSSSNNSSSVPYLTRNAPEGRYCLPYLGQGITFLLYPPWDLLQSWNERYGGIICFPLLGTTIFSLTDADAIKAVLQSHTACFKKDVENTMKEFLVILGTGIVTSEGASWLQQRRKMSHPLRVDVLHIIPHQTLQAVQRLMRHLDRAAHTNSTSSSASTSTSNSTSKSTSSAATPTPTRPKQSVVPLGSLLRHLTLQVISGSFLSLSAEESDSNFARLYLPIVDEANVRVWHSYRGYCFFLPSFWKYHWNVYRLNAYVSQLIRQRWMLRRQQQPAPPKNNATPRQEDILDKVLADCEKEFSKVTVLPEYAVRQLRDEMKTFMLAGHE